MPGRRIRKVISASRRTELVAHYPDYLARRLHELGPAGIHTVVVWTKDPSNLLRHRDLREALTGVGQVFVQWTVTGLGGTLLEPNVPPPIEQLRLLPDVAACVGDPQRIHLRYDPLISARRSDEQFSNVDLDLFRSIAEPFARAGVPAVHTSFVTVYRKVTRRLSAAGVALDQYAPEQRRAFLTKMTDAARGLGMDLLTCCEPDFPIRRCIDGDLLTALHPTQEPCLTDRAKGQRTLCGCTASLDVGRYLPCPNGCLYCYARPGPRKAAGWQPAPPGVDATG
jgi:DNA repair photolyase